MQSRFSVLVNGLPFAADRYKVPVYVWPKKRIFRIACCYPTLRCDAVISAALLSFGYFKLHSSPDYRFTFTGVLSLSRSRCFRFRLVVPFGSSKSIRENSHICVLMQSDPNIKAGNVLAAVAGSVQINIRTDTVSQLRFSHIHTTVQQINYSFLARILNHLQTAYRNSRCVLGDTILRRRDGAVL